jgi:predicted homoserine dehydrogenase-like protein
MTLDLNLSHQAARPATKHYRIGVVGAGFIMRDVQLVAYRNAGYNVAAIAARRVPQAREVAQFRGIPKVYEDWRELVADPSSKCRISLCHRAGGEICWKQRVIPLTLRCAGAAAPWC